HWPAQSEPGARTLHRAPQAWRRRARRPRAASPYDGAATAGPARLPPAQAHLRPPAFRANNARRPAKDIRDIFESRLSEARPLPPARGAARRALFRIRRIANPLAGARATSHRDDPASAHDPALLDASQRH